MISDDKSNINHIIKYEISLIYNVRISIYK